MGTPHFGHGRWASGGGVGLKLWGRGMTRYSVTLPVPDKSLVRVGASRPITNSYLFAGLIAQGAQAIILNWTEIMLLVLEEIAQCRFSLPPQSMPSPLLIAHWRNRAIKRLF
jgi:hypothetical protein